MSWKNSHTAWSRLTLKSRLIISFIGSFSFLLLLSSIFIYNSQKKYLLQTAKQILQNFGNEFHYEYICQEEEPITSSFIKITDLPADCILELANPTYDFVPYCAFKIPSRLLINIAGTSHGEPALAIWDDGLNKIADIKTFNQEAHLKYINYEFNEESYGRGNDEVIMLLTNHEHNRILAQSNSSYNMLPVIQKLPVTDNKLKTGFYDIESNNHDLLLFNQEMYDGNYLIIASDLSPIKKNLNHLLWIFIWITIGSLPAGLIISILLAGKFVSGIRRVSKATKEIASGNYAMRIISSGEGKEINELIDSFNAMTTKTSELLTELQNITDNIAHDLRTPITRIKALAEIKLVNNEDLGFAGRISENCDDMISMIDTALEITRIEKNIIQAKYQNINFNQLINKLYEAFSTLAEDGKLNFKVILPESDISVIGNPRRLEQLLANLIDNAIKYTPEGGTVTIKTFTDSNNMLILTVTDTGCGIATQDLPNIFNRFYRADSSRSTPGNGLGLSLVKAIVETMNGKISVNSQIGQGTTFIIQLPLAPK